MKIKFAKLCGIGYAGAAIAEELIKSHPAQSFWGICSEASKLDWLMTERAPVNKSHDLSFGQCFPCIVLFMGCSLYEDEYFRSSEC